ncbi:hypothetical protein Gpo141_00007336 [Globisporangium polare]
MEKASPPLPPPLLMSVAVVLRAKQHTHPPLVDVARIIERFVDHSVHWSVLLAVQEELPHLLQRLMATNREISAEKLGIAMQTAAKKGNLSAFQCLHAYRPQVRIPRAVMDKAAEKNHLHVCQWLHSKGAGCTEKALESAALNGHLEMVRWLYAQERETSSSVRQATQMAARGGHVAILQFLDATKHESCQRTVAMRAAEFGRVSVLQYMQQRHSDKFLRNELLAIARRCNKPGAVSWLSES